jgi:hypothetical protein
LGLVLPAYLRQGYVADIWISEWGSMLWILPGFLLIAAVGFTAFFHRKRSLSAPGASPSLFDRSIYLGYFVSFIASASLMGFAPASLLTFRLGEFLFGIAIGGGLQIVLIQNPLFPYAPSHPLPRKFVSLALQLAICAPIMGLAIDRGYAIQWAYFSWLFVVMGLGAMWRFVVVNLTGLFFFYLILTAMPLLIHNFRVKSPQHRVTPVISGVIGLIFILLVGGGLSEFNMLQVDRFLDPTEWAFASKYSSRVDRFGIELSPPNASWSALFDHVYSVLESNLYLDRFSNDILFAHPSEHFRKGWYWDTAFTVLIWKNYDPTIAEQLLLDYLRGAVNPNGLVSHMYYPNCKSGISQPPLFAWAAMEIYNRTENKEFLREIYPLLDRAFAYWENFRDPEKNSLYSWQTLDETGQDNTLALGPDPTATEALDLTAYLAFEGENLAKMADELNLNKDHLKYLQKSVLIQNAARALLWDDETQFFYSILKRDGSPILVQAASAFLSLISGIATPQQAEMLVTRHLLNSSEFWTTFPIPTTALSDPTYEPVYWRGPIWVNMNYLIALGLERYGYHEIAHTIYLKTITMVDQLFQERGKVYELYHPLTGNVTDVFNNGGGMPSSNMVGWTGLVNTILLDKIFGIRETPTRLSISPKFPVSWINSTISYYNPRYSVTFHWDSENRPVPEIELIDVSLEYQ